MTELNNQPFLVSMAQAAQQTGNFEDYRTLLKEQHTLFKNFLDETCKPDTPAPARFDFLKQAEYEICCIRLYFADQIREHNQDFYMFWSKLIVDTRRFIDVGVETLEFLKNCPAHLIAEPAKTVSEYRWTGSHRDLIEVLAALFKMNVIQLKNGNPLEFTPFANFFGSIFGISYPNPNSEMSRVVNRKKDPTPFLNRMIDRLKAKTER